MQLNFAEQLEQIQYKVASVVSGCTSRQRLLEELGWETLYDRRWYRSLCHFCLLSKSKTPDYLFQEIPERQTDEPNISRTKLSQMVGFGPHHM